MLESIMLFMFSQQIRIEKMNEITFKVSTEGKVTASYTFNGTPCIAVWNAERQHWN